MDMCLFKYMFDIFPDVLRGCETESIDDACITWGDDHFCSCSNDLCNSATMHVAPVTMFVAVGVMLAAVKGLI